jgi:hypothetical protein
MSHSQPVGSVAAAAQATSTPITAASCSRRSTATATTTASAKVRWLIQRCTPAPATSLPSLSSWLTSRATVAWSAEPGTMRITKAASSAPSVP